VAAKTTTTTAAAAMTATKTKATLAFRVNKVFFLRQPLAETMQES